MNHRPLVVVLGASGFIGTAVTAALARRPIRLRAVARSPISIPDISTADVEVVPADLTDRAQLERAVAGADVVVHLVLQAGGWRAADHDPAGSERVNVQIMRDLLAHFRRTATGGEPPVVVYAGAASQIGLPPDRPIDGREPDHPATVYDRQKLDAEIALTAATERGVVRGVTLRLPTVFGTSEQSGAVDNGVVSFMARRALAGEPLTMWHDGSVRRDVVHVEDIAAAFVAAIDHAGALAGDHWLVGSGSSRPLGEIFTTIADAVAQRTGRDPVPVTSVDPPAHAPATDFRSLVIDAGPFHARTGWRPQVSLRDGVGRTVAHLSAHMEGTQACTDRTSLRSISTSTS